VVIPLCVIEELDNQKKRQDDAGKNARKAIKQIDKWQTEAVDGVMKLSNGVRIRIENTDLNDLHTIDLEDNKVDNYIIGLAVKLKNAGEEVTVVSNDGACRVKARHFGVPAESLEQDRVQVEIGDVYSGFREILVPELMIAEFYDKKKLDLIEFEDLELFENQFILLKNEGNEKQTALAKVSNNQLVPLKYANIRPWDITPRNVEQVFFLEALMDPKIQLVTAMGGPGTGKTLLAAAASGYQTVDLAEYKKVAYYKTIVPIGPDMGALPGTEADKLRPWMASAYDAYEYLLGSEENLESLVEKKLIELSSLTYIRGRSLPNIFIIVDECANLTPNEVKTIISRAGEGTKVVLIGDPYQIDHPFLDSQNNGLVYTIERFKGQKEFAHITLTKAERSRLSGLAAELL
jgi:PhoH-like ATPase